jgi:hypothetical protein
MWSCDEDGMYYTGGRQGDVDGGVYAFIGERKPRLAC